MRRKSQSKAKTKKNTKKVVSQDSSIGNMEAATDKITRPAKESKKKKKKKKANKKVKKKNKMKDENKATKGTRKGSAVQSGKPVREIDARKLQLLQEDSPELINLLADFKKKSKILKQQLTPLLIRIKKAELPVTEGVQFLEIKFHLLLTYCQHITFYLLLKAEGQRIQSHPVIESLLRIRTMMERLKPLERKLKHEIDRLLQAGNGAPLLNSQSAAKPDVSNLLPVDGNESDDQDKLYRAPKLMSVPFETGDSSGTARANQQMQRRMKTSRVLKELKEAYSSAPESIRMREGSNALLDQEEKERTRFEEDNFTRLPVTRKLKRRRTAAQRQVGNMNDVFEEIKDFGKLEQLAGSESVSGTPNQSLGSKSSSFQRQVHALEQHNRKKRTIAWSSADVEVGLRDPEEIRRGRPSFDPNQETKTVQFSHTPSNNDAQPTVSIADEDLLYQRVAKQRNDKQRKRKAQYTRPEMMTAAEEKVRDHNPRVASKKILRNKGLVAYRKKEARNPRIVKKVKFAKAKKRQKGQRPSMREHEHNYSGETSGIRDDITHSRQLKR